MDTGLKGKKVLITGASRGLGKGFADGFAKEGCDVIINSRSEERIQSVARELQAKHPDVKISAIAADLINLEECDRLYEEASKDGQIDILINNVGIFYLADFFKLTDEEWLNILNINVMSNVRLCRRALSDMLKRNSGKIIVMASEAGYRPNPDYVHYSTTKSALLGFTRAVAELTKGTKVTVNSICPVSTWTEGVAEFQQSLAEKHGLSLEDQKKNYLTMGQDNTSLIQRFASVEEVTMSVILIAANDAINGNNVLIDGGVIKHI
jgi:short-subunit dehydrogenase